MRSILRMIKIQDRLIALLRMEGRLYWIPVFVIGAVLLFSPLRAKGEELSSPQKRFEEVVIENEGLDAIHEGGHRSGASVPIHREVQDGVKFKATVHQRDDKKKSQDFTFEILCPNSNYPLKMDTAKIGGTYTPKGDQANGFDMHFQIQCPEVQSGSPGVMRVPTAIASPQPGEANLPEAGSQVVAEAGEPLRHSFSLMPRTRFARLIGRARDSSASSNLISNLGIGGELRWHQKWNESLETFASYRYDQIQFSDPTQTNISLSEDSQTQNGFGIGARYQILRNLYSEARLGLDEHRFIPAFNSFTLSLQTALLPTLEAMIDYVPVSLFGIDLGIRPQFSLLLGGGEVEAEAGIAYSGEIYLKRMLGKQHLLRAGTFIGVQQQNTTGAEHNFISIGLQFGYQFFLNP